MKKKILYIAFALFLAFVACKEETIFEDVIADGTPPGLVTINSITPLAGKLYFEWTLPQDEDFMYVLVSYTKSDSTERVLTYSKYNTEGIIIPNLITQEYEFSFTSVDESGTKSEAVLAKGTPLTPAQITAANTVRASSTVGAIVFDWDNPTADSLLAVVKVSVSNTKDSTIAIEYTGSNTGLRVEVDIVERDYYLVFVDPEQNEARSQSFSLAAYKEVKFDRTIFMSEYTGYSSFMRVFDGDWSVHFASGGPFPRTIPFETENALKVSKIHMYVSRLNEKNWQHFPNEVEILTSMTDEATAYESQGVFTLEEVDENGSNWYDARILVLENVPECKYFKMVVNGTYSSGVALVIGEMEIYGAEVK